MSRSLKCATAVSQRALSLFLSFHAFHHYKTLMYIYQKKIIQKKGKIRYYKFNIFETILIYQIYSEIIITISIAFVSIKCWCTAWYVDMCINRMGLERLYTFLEVRTDSTSFWESSSIQRCFSVINQLKFESGNHPKPVMILTLIQE